MENETIYETAKFFLEKTRAVHISCFDGKFFNGVILEVRIDFLILEDEKLGETPIFFREINNIEARRPREIEG